MGKFCRCITRSILSKRDCSTICAPQSLILARGITLSRERVLERMRLKYSYLEVQLVSSATINFANTFRAFQDNATRQYPHTGYPVDFNSHSELLDSSADENYFYVRTFVLFRGLIVDNDTPRRPTSFCHFLQLADSNAVTFHSYLTVYVEKCHSIAKKKAITRFPLLCNGYLQQRNIFLVIHCKKISC